MEIINLINEYLWSYILIALLILSALYFTFRTRGVQFVMLGEMWRLLFNSGKGSNDSRDAGTERNKTVSSFQALMVSLASRVGTGNLAGVAGAIAIGGPGTIFWMWICGDRKSVV